MAEPNARFRFGVQRKVPRTRTEPNLASTSYKRPPSPTPLLGTSPKRAHLWTNYNDVDWSLVPAPTLSTAMDPPSVAAVPIKRPVGRPRKLAPLAPATQTTPSLQSPPQSPVLVVKKAEMIHNTGQWSVDELSTFYEYALGQDSDSIFNKITMSSNKCWKQFEDRVGILRDAKQMKSQWDTSLTIYKKLVPLLKFTGGGADTDEEPDWEDKDAVNSFLRSQATNGHDVEGLSAPKVRQWLTSGWFALFDNRYGTNPKAVREVPRSSADTLSDIEGGLPGDDIENDSDVDIVDNASIPVTPAPVTNKPKNKGIATDPREVKPSTWDRSKPASRAPPIKAKKEDRLQGLKTKDKARRVLERLLDAAINF
ncbi:hypothetical protein C8R43DRAFT_1211186 [Mycena crocata]|nr:hypothetical protein C8R43DRAFT_1211186 [Mycena crocata]